MKMYNQRSTAHIRKPSLWLAAALVFAGACDTKRTLPDLELETGGEAEEPPADTSASSTPSRFLYVSSGSCFGGDITAGAVPAGSNTIVRFNVETREFAGLVVDYNQLSSSDSPVSLVDYSDTHLLVLVENTGGRRVDIVDKISGSVSPFLTNSNLNGILRDLMQLSDGSFLVAKSTAIERFNSNKARITSGANPFINAPGGACATSTTWMVGAARLQSGQYAFIHSNTSPNNKIGIISASGYSGTANCLSTQASFNTAARPTSLLVEKETGDLLVSYGSATPVANAIYSYQVNSGTGAISGAIASYTDYGYVTAPSKMHQDASTGLVYVASARASHSSIEKLSYDSSTRTLVRNETFATNSVYTKCVTGIATGE